MISHMDKTSSLVSLLQLQCSPKMLLKQHLIFLQGIRAVVKSVHFTSHAILGHVIGPVIMLSSFMLVPFLLRVTFTSYIVRLLFSEVVMLRQGYTMG